LPFQDKEKIIWEEEDSLEDYNENKEDKRINENS